MATDEFEVPPFDPGNPPKLLMFFRNGLVAVFDQHDRQMPRYQRANSHREAMFLMKEDGIDWWLIPRIEGDPIFGEV